MAHHSTHTASLTGSLSPARAIQLPRRLRVSELDPQVLPPKSLHPGGNSGEAETARGGQVGILKCQRGDAYRTLNHVRMVLNQRVGGSQTKELVRETEGLRVKYS